MFTNPSFSSQTYGCWNVAGTGAVDEDPYQRMEHQLDEVKYLIEQYAMRNHTQQPQQGYDPSSSMYQSDWYDGVDQGYGGVPSQQPLYFQQQFQPSLPFIQQHLHPLQEPYEQPQLELPPAYHQADPLATSLEPSLEDFVNQLMESNLQWQQRTDATIQGLQTQLSQLTSTLSKLQAHESTQLFSHTVLTHEGDVPDVQSHELVERIGESQDVAGPLDETPQETLVDEISHDLVGAEEMTMSTCMDISTSLEDPMSDLSAEFPELTVVDTFAGFTCADCEGEYICPVCAEIEACLRGDPLMPEDGEIVADIQRVELLEEQVKETTQPLPSTILLPATETYSSGLEYAPTPFLGQFEYAHLENDAQLQTICDMTAGLLHPGARRCLNYAYVKNKSCPQAACFIIVKVLPGTMPRPSTLTYQGTNSKDGNEFKITLWDPGGGKRCKPWWGFLDQFKHKPP